MKTHCSIANILTLNLANMDNHPKRYLIGILEVILPFFNGVLKRNDLAKTLGMRSESFVLKKSDF